MPPRKPRSRQRSVLIVDPSVESRDPVIDELDRNGYELFATGSMDAACALVSVGQPELVLVNLSAFSAKSLGRLGRALSRRRRIRVVGMVSQFSPDGGTTVRVIRLPRGELLVLALELSRPN
jgi:DNA-binding NtrC family response regulator